MASAFSRPNASPGFVHNSGYSSLGRLIWADNPEADGLISYTYFANGELKTRTDPRGVTTTISIDGLGRVLKKDYSATTPATPNARYCYDGRRYEAATDSCVVQSRSDYPAGGLSHSAARRPNGSLVSQTEYMAIDPLGRVLTSRQTTEGLSAMTFLYEYAVGGALWKVQYPSGRWVTYDINGANRVGAVRNGTTGSSYYLQNAQYKPAGALASATVGLEAGQQWTETWEYNSRLQARKLRIETGSQRLLGLDWIYSPNWQYNAGQDMYEETGSDNNGNLRLEKLTHSTGGSFSVDRSYAYDQGNRLIWYAEPTRSQTFGYDAFGNVWQTGGAGVPWLRQNGPSWYLMPNQGVRNRLANTAYDAAGNQTQLSLSVGTAASYDAEGRVSKVEVSGNAIAIYDYDGERRRVRRTSGSVNTYYAYDAMGQLMVEYGGAANPVGTQYLVQDYLGSTRLILNAQGGCQERIDYTPFGGQVMRSGQACYASGAVTNLPLFTGQMRDGGTSAGTETDLDYFSARYFWGTLGRFTSPDEPLLDQHAEDAQSWNLYSYVRSNPLNFTDPTGRCKKGNDGKYHDSDEGPCVVHGETSVTVTEKAPRVRDHAAEVQAEMTRLQYEAWKRNQERSKPKEDQPLTKEAQAVLTTAYQRTAHDLGCAGLGFVVGDTAGALFVSGQPNAGFRSPVSGKLVGGSKPFAGGGAAAGSSTLSGALRDALPQRLPTQIPTPVGGPSTGRALSMQGSNRLGVVLGRWAPFIGAAGMAYGAYELNACLSQ